MNKFTALFLVFSFLALSGNLFAKERKGAELIIEKKDWQQIRGELIAIKKDSLLLKEQVSGADVSVEVDKIQVVRIKKKSKIWLGVLVGGAIGATIGYAQGDDPGNQFFPLTAGHKAAIWGIAAGSFGALIGWLSSIDKTFVFERARPEVINAYLNQLRSKARVRNYQ